MTKRINQKLAHKRKVNDQHADAKESKKARKAEVVPTTPVISSLVVEQLVGGPTTALSALAGLARCGGAGGGEEDPPDEMDEFFAGGGQATHILHMLDTNQEKNKANDVAAVFNAVEAVVARVVRCGAKLGPMSRDVATELVRKVNSDYGKEIVLLLSGTNTAYQAKSVLRMLTAMVTLGPTQAREVLLKVNWEHDNWDTLSKRSSKTDPPDVRTCFIHFLLAFLFEPSSLVLKDFFSMKTRLASLFPGLMQDKAETVMLVVETLRSKVLENAAVSKTQKMKVFGSHNIKPVLALLGWTGRKKSEGAEGDVEEMDAVKESVTAFLKVLLGSTKQGVVFPDPAAGQGDKIINPLAREVLLSLAKPWESVSLAGVVVELVTACPDQVDTLMKVLEDNWVPRDSPSWHMVVDLIITVVERQDSKALGESMKHGFPVGKVVENVVFPTKLLEKVVRVGLDMDSVVSTKCLELLTIMVTNLELFLSSLPGSLQDVAKTTAYSLVGRHLTLGNMWASLTGYLTRGEAGQVINTLRVINFIVGHLGVAGNLDVGEVLKEVELNKDKLGERRKEVQLRALTLFSTITNSSTSMPSKSAFLTKLCTEDTFSLLLDNLANNEGQEMLSSTEILSGLVKSAGICFGSGLDLGLVVALVDRDNYSLVGKVLLEAIERRKQLEEQVLALRFQEVCLRSQNISSDKDLFESLMSPDYTPSMVSSFLPPSSSEEMFSPLTLSLLANHSQNSVFVERFFSRLVFLFQDVDIFCKQIQTLTDSFSPAFKGFLTSTLSPLSSPPPSLPPLPTTPSWSLAQSTLVQLLHFPSSSPTDLTNLFSILPTDMQAGLVRLTVNRMGRLNTFNPFKASDNTNINLVMPVLELASKLNIQAPEMKNQFALSTQSYLASLVSSPPDQGDTEQSLVRDSFRLLPLPSTSLQQFASSLSQLPVNMFYKTQDQSTTTLTTILTGVCQGLSLLPQADLSDPTLVTVVAKLSCLVEVLLDTQCDLQEMTGHLTKIVAASPSLCQALSSNLVVVLVKTCRPNYLQLAECLVKLDRKHLDAFKMWVCHEKHSVTEKLWPLVRVVLQSQEFESEKKFITILLKKVVNQVETILTEPGSSDCEQELLDMVTLLSQFSKSDKQLELWKKGVGERMESVEEALKLSANVILLKFRMLATVQKISGGCDSRLMRECFLPLLHQISVSFKLGPLMGSTVLALCSAARECKELVENKMFVKEIGKNPLTWQKFFRSVLKYSLKVGDPGVPALDLLSTICDFLIRGSKLAEVEDIVEMVTSHSLYLGTVLGPSCTTKTALIQLLMSLSPASCTLDQIPLLLSGYMATLHPSDRALLTFLGMHEKAGLDLSQFQPFMFGPVAVQHYAAMAGGAWKQPKVSEVLSILDKDLMRRSCVSLPLSLPLDPQADVDKEAFPDTTLYDPRFILPFLSQLLSPEMYMDKHMKLVDSGALSYAISSLASREWGVRAAGYHVLARVQTAMDTAKLAQEKQVWLHLISLIRNGVASSSNNTSRCVRLSSLVTTFLVRVVDILQTPLSPLYRTISRSILAKPAMDMQAVPEFSRLLNSADIKHTAEQRWVLEVVKEGMRDNLDYSLANRSFVCKILQSQWGSVVIDRVGHLQVLDVIERCVGTNYGCTDLLTRHGLLTWLAVVVKRDKVDKLFVKKVVAIVSLALETARNIDKRKQEEKKGVIVEVIRTEMVILVDLIKQFAGQKNDLDMLEEVDKLYSKLQL
eukprot:GFUD01041266.1.p1 GENE.GFUD01041266.1~~GFUD01041266.1.p1  ORF type:complete len:1730 (-),score=625.36 GFUD01041266.1:48-5237(-)